MLVLSRRIGKSLQISDVVVTLIEIRADKVRLAVTAPRYVHPPPGGLRCHPRT